MIDLGTLGGLLQHDHSLAAYCPRCDSWRVLPLAELVAAGHGTRRLPVTVRCRDCGEVGWMQVRPPVPTRGPGGWMEPLATSTYRRPPPGLQPATVGRT